jgi:glycosyltransferase involved in cell wall biosynthesis
MRIVFVSDVIYPYVKGGAEKRIYELSSRLVAKGHEVHIFGVKWWDGPATFEKDGITYHGVCRKKALYVNGRRSIIEAIWFALCLAVPLSRERFDIIDCNQHPYFPLFVCKAVASLRKTKFFATWHEYWGDYWYEYLGGLKGSFGRMVEKASAQMPDQIISVSRRTAGALKSDGVPARKVLVVTNGIPFERISRIAPSHGTSDVVFTGRLITDKHVDVLLHACAATERKIGLCILGDGPEKERLEKLAGELNITDTTCFAGFLEEEELIARMKAARLFVLPSSREGFSITTLEAMACGLPIVTVDCERNYATDLIEEGRTGMIARLDEKEIAGTIMAILEDEPRRQRMSAECISAAEAYDWDVLVVKLEQAYLGKPADNAIADDQYK